MRAALTGRVKRYAERRGLLPNQGELLLCGVSGGADSMCMLSLMSELARMRKFEVAAAHFNHGLRGESSERDAHFVRDYCDAHGVRLETGARTGAAPFGASESESREARYAFFSSAAEKLGAIAVATAHNADDNAETLLLQLARGSGSLPGIAPERVFKSGLRVVRPMLCATRGEIDAYLAARAVPHVEDESNADSRYARNRVRLEVMPALRAVNARFAAHALALCESLRDDGAYLEAQARELLLGAGFTAERPAIAAQPLESAHRAIAARALIRAAELLGTHLYREQVDGALELLHSGKRGRTIDLPGGFALSRTREAVVFTSPSAQIVHDSFTQND